MKGRSVKVAMGEQGDSIKENAGGCVNAEEIRVRGCVKGAAAAMKMAEGKKSLGSGWAI
eukprot:CAMPEP_0170129164 /NCGR_PEP_ID=MMETSP0020_2-20130122/21670_1 /TAXON_ID=98059 /ORGANISM="Dinobryon sp., Strain UTEXLB2267" /LENGTH=58 /DNA_ID=CAMNT_0010363357 /DNA_START=215 /DNA_END=391 /DNA_ORIENTATION=+